MKIRERLKRSQKEKGIDPNSERLICTGLIISSRVCTELSEISEIENLMVSDFTSWIASTCIEHYREHKSSIGIHIKDALHLAKRSQSINEYTASLVEEFLQSISSEYERSDKFNEKYVLEKIAFPYFKARAIKNKIQEADALLKSGHIEEAQEAIEKNCKVERHIEEFINPFNNQEVLKRAFERQDNPLFTLPGPAGDLINVQLHRGNFFTFRGPAKRTKSFTLLELAKAASKSRCNVAFIGAGDMTEEEYALRLATNLSGRSNLEKDCKERWSPCLDCVKNQNNSCAKPERLSRVGLSEETLNEKMPDPENAPRGYRPCSVCKDDHDFCGSSWWEKKSQVEPLTWTEALRYGNRFTRRIKGRDFKLKSFPSKAITPNKLESFLERWRDEQNWIPDVIIIDYMDEFGSDSRDDAYRHREADKWSRIRAIAMKWDCLVISADQSDSSGYTAETIGMKNFNEDRRRNDITTGCIGLNQTESEKARGIMRWSWAFLRGGASYTPAHQVYVIQDLACGKPLVGSWWRKYGKENFCGK